VASVGEGGERGGDGVYVVDLAGRDGHDQVAGLGKEGSPVRVRQRGSYGTRRRKRRVSSFRPASS
jgi:hypothetical protein